MAQSPLRTSSMTHQVTPRMFSPSTLTIASVRRSAISVFWSGVKTPSMTFTLMRGMGTPCGLGVGEEGRAFRGARRRLAPRGRRRRARKPRRRARMPVSLAAMSRPRLEPERERRLGHGAEAREARRFGDVADARLTGLGAERQAGVLGERGRRAKQRGEPVVGAPDGVEV